MMALLEPMKAFQPDIHLPSYRYKRDLMPPLGRQNFVFVRKAGPCEIRFAVPAEISQHMGTGSLWKIAVFVNLTSIQAKMPAKEEIWPG